MLEKKQKEIRLLLFIIVLIIEFIVYMAIIIYICTTAIHLVNIYQDHISLTSFISMIILLASLIPYYYIFKMTQNIYNYKAAFDINLKNDIMKKITVEHPNK
jgi:magnesium-transporting ATPase (P-type)